MVQKIQLSEETHPSQKAVFRFADLEGAQGHIKSVLSAESLSQEELQRLAELRAKTNSASLQVLEDEWVEYQEETLSFEEVCALLCDKTGLDLQEELNIIIEVHDEWGLVSAAILKGCGLVERGEALWSQGNEKDALKARMLFAEADKYPDDIDEYAALFEQHRFTRKGIYELIMRLQNGEDWMPVFNPGLLNYQELWQILIEGHGIPYWEDSNGFQAIERLKEVHPRQIPDIAILERMSAVDQKNAFRAAYELAPSKKTDQACIIFTPNNREISMTGKSATRHAQATVAGRQFIDPQSDLIRWRTQYEFTGIKPDISSWTQYPTALFPDGNVPVLHWHVQSGLALHSINPGLSRTQLGVRPALG